MYFNTHPAAEHKFLSAISPSGEQSWRWIELAIQTPLFILSTNFKIEEGFIGRHFMFGCLKDLLGTISELEGVFTILGVGVLSPGYMNGSECYKFGNIKEIWQHPKKLIEVYVLDDGSRLQYPPCEDYINEQEMELAMRL